MQYANRLLVILFLSLGASPLVHAVSTAATVSEVSGRAEATNKVGISRNLYRNSAVFPGDRITTGDDSSVSLLFTDRSRFELKSNADFAVENYAYDAQKNSGSFTSRLLRGSFRFITGLVAKLKPDTMKVGLPVATIGIRGTHVVGEAHATSALVILLEPVEGPHPTAIMVSNDYGETLVDQPGYGTEIPDEHSPPSPARRMSMRTIENLMRSFRSISRVRPPMLRH